MTARERAAGFFLTLIVIELTAATAYIHLTLGGVIFTLNGLGYLGLAAAYAAAALPIPLARRFGWLPRIGLAGFALVTIGAYLVIGPYFSLGWIAKGIEVAIIGLVGVHLLVSANGPRGLVNVLAAPALATDRSMEG
jgi:hypothetical protein